METMGNTETHLVKTLDVSLVSTDEGSEQGNVQVVVTIPAKEFPYLQVIKSSLQLCITGFH